MASLVTEQTEAKKQEEISNKINEALNTGNFMIAKAINIKTNVIIQKRTIILGSAQPFNSK